MELESEKRESLDYYLLETNDRSGKQTTFDILKF